MDSYSILVILLSITLAIFLWTAIIVLVKVYSLVRKLESVAEKAHHAAENVEDMTSGLNLAATISGFGVMVSKIVNAFKKRGE